MADEVTYDEDASCSKARSAISITSFELKRFLKVILKVAIMLHTLSYKAPRTLYEKRLAALYRPCGDPQA